VRSGIVPSTPANFRRDLASRPVIHQPSRPITSPHRDLSSSREIYQQVQSYEEDTGHFTSPQRQGTTTIIPPSPYIINQQQHHYPPSTPQKQPFTYEQQQQQQQQQPVMPFQQRTPFTARRIGTQSGYFHADIPRPTSGVVTGRNSSPMGPPLTGRRKSPYSQSHQSGAVISSRGRGINTNSSIRRRGVGVREDFVGGLTAHGGRR
jgi:hypothetical protein